FAGLLQQLVYNNYIIGLSKEIAIPVPWGILAGKTFGDSTKPAVLCLHGWLDNCNSFDKLIPLLPKDKFYVCVDLPGHGLSSHISLGMFYTLFFYVATVERIVNHFKWKKFSFLSHSLGANISGMYSGTYPDKVDKLIIIDVIGVFPLDGKLAVENLRSSIESYLKYEDKLSSAAPRYTYEKAKERLLVANKSLDSHSADILLERGTTRHEDVVVFYRSKYLWNEESSNYMSTRSGLDSQNILQVTIFFIKEYHGFYTTFRSGPLPQHPCHLSLISYLFYDQQKREYVVVEGDHHLHMVNAEEVAKQISPFLKHGLNQMYNILV
uniref:AB hydrolase-1 domain-containing protein n=1 Tax=Ciona intestinalis TaxID=7719 RepID=F6S021_CIOIN